MTSLVILRVQMLQCKVQFKFKERRYKKTSLVIMWIQNAPLQNIVSIKRKEVSCIIQDFDYKSKFFEYEKK